MGEEMLHGGGVAGFGGVDERVVEVSGGGGGAGGGVMWEESDGDVGVGMAER